MVMFRVVVFVALAGVLSGCSDKHDDLDSGLDAGVDSGADSSVDVPSSNADRDTGSPGEDQGVDVEDEPVPPREPGTRAPRTAMCDDLDPSRCLLPWPSDVFVRADPGTITGLRIAIDPQAVLEEDDVTSLLAADGHSRISPLVTVFKERLDPATSGEDGVANAVRLVVAEPGERFGELAPVRLKVTPDPDNLQETVLVAYPLTPLAANTEYAVAVLDLLRDGDGRPPERDRRAGLVLGLEAPEGEDEASLQAYHGPTRMALEAAEVDLAQVVRAWSFTTRSRRDSIVDLEEVRAQMVAAVEGGEVALQVKRVVIAPSPTIAVTVQGTMIVPDFVSQEGVLRRDEEGRPLAEGTREALFRVAVPVGDGDYKVIMYGHGFGGDVSDPSFDGVITGAGAGKVNIQFDDWTEDGVLVLVSKLTASISGTDQAVAGLIESIAMGVAIQYALDGAIGDLLEAAEIDGQPNPAAGRRPDTQDIVWAGGSLGGTMGLVYASVEPTVRAAVLNVPGTGLSHYLRFSNLYNVLELILKVNYRFEADRALAVAMGQLNFDRIDGGIWFGAVEEPPVCLVQESVGDPVMPNIGTDLVATSVGALHLGEILSPIWGLEPAEEALGRSAVTQYKVNQDRDELGIHGFGDRNDVAGRAAQDQIRAFINSVWEGQPRIALPQACLDNVPVGCDFSDLE